jgi:hypothetical protein
VTSLLSRTPIWPPGRPATSTQLPFEKLRELLTHWTVDSGWAGRSAGMLNFTL